MSRGFPIHVRLVNDVRGAAAVEFAYVIPVFILLAFGIIEGGRALWTLNSLQYAVERAARCAVVDTATCASATATQTFAASQVSGQTVNSTVFTVTTAACGTLVSASLPFTAFMVPISVTLKASSCRPT